MKEMYDEKDIVYQNEYILSKERFMNWGRESAFHGIRLRFVVFWCIMMVVCMILAFTTKAWQGVILGLFCFYQGFFRWRILVNNQYNMLSKRHGESDWTRRILFKQDGIQVIDKETLVCYNYEDVEEIKELEHEIKIIFNNDTVIRLYTDTFLNSNWEECKKFIYEKAGI